jgi:hypothetical protein
LENLAVKMEDLTETARDVLRGEMKSRGLAMPGELGFAAATRSGSRADSESRGHGEDRDDDGAPAEFTWKVPLCEGEDRAHAMVIGEALRRAGIDSWYEDSSSGGGISGPRLAVAADQLERAQQIAAVPIDQQVLADYREEAPPYETPRCPECGEEDPVLESAEPTNSWLCEGCGHQWTEPGDDSESAT